MSNITKFASKKDMENLLKGNENALHRLDEDKRDEFKQNFLELWNNQYLIQQALPTELLDFAIQITQLGLSINPYAKQLYILPFAEKGKSTKKLEAVFRKEATEQLLADKGFFIECDNIWSINGVDTLESEMSYAEQARLEKTKASFVDENFLGFKFTLTFVADGKIPKQHFVVGVDYLKAVTKQLQSQEHKIKNWSHKAYRSAFDNFNLSAGRRNGMEEKIAQLEAMNHATLEAEVIEDKPQAPQKSLKMETQTPQQEVTKEDIEKMYKDANADTKAKMAQVFSQHKEWRGYSGVMMSSLRDELHELS